jgi:hypothetical protein
MKTNKFYPEKDDPMMLLIESMLGGDPSDAIVASEKRGQSWSTQDIRKRDACKEFLVQMIERQLEELEIKLKLKDMKIESFSDQLRDAENI